MKRYYVFRTGEAGDTFDADYEPDALGKWVKFEDAQAEVDRRDARITELEAALADRPMILSMTHTVDDSARKLITQMQQGHAALTQQIAENAELKRKLANHAARLGTALKTRTELLGKLRDARIAELEAEAGVDRALLALADARLNREVLRTKGGA